MSADAINFSPYREDWPERFDSAATTLLAVLGTGFEVHHVGSTAVPGLSAKDCIDTLVIAPSQTKLEWATPRVHEAGFEYRPGAFPENPPHRFFRRVEGGVRTHHVHLLVKGSAEVHGYLAFRALLRTDASARREYETIKQQLVTARPDDRAAYIEGKGPVVESLLVRALLRWPEGAELG